MMTSRALCALVFAAAMVPPLPGIVVIAIIALAMVLNGMYGVPNLMVLNAESPAGRATTMTLNSSAMYLGTALGGMVGGLTLTLGGYVALGYVAPVFLLVSSAIIWLTRPRPTAELATAA
jgi:predicted MFS family arabinose efflux permease